MKQRGFTLLEVLVATLIMAIAVTGLLSALSTSMRNASRVTEYDRAVMLARQKMDELLLSTALPRMAPVEGVWQPELAGGLECGWRARITPFDKKAGAGPGSPILERVELEVWWMSGGRRRTFALEGYRRSEMLPGEVGI